MFGAAEVGDLYTGRIDLTTCTPYGNHADLVTFAVGNQCSLDSKSVYAIDDVAIGVARQDVEVVERQVFLDGMYPAVRVDLQDTFCHHLDLGHSQRPGQGMQLTIDIGLGNVVEINKRDFTNGRACQCLCRPGTHATDADNADMRLPECFQRTLAVEAANAAKATLHGCVVTDRSSVQVFSYSRNIPENGCVWLLQTPTMKPMELVDTHCHLDLPAFDADRAAVLARSRASGVSRIVVPGVQSAGWDQLQGFCAADDNLYPALGLHPVYLEQHVDADLKALESQLAEHRPVAVGEIGLDYYLKHLDQARQQALLEAQLEMARAADLPVILHVRKAHEQMLSILKRIRVRGGIAHAFNGSLQQAGEYAELGFKLGFGGMLTFERSTKLRALAEALPIESIVLETDAPDMTVAQHRGERNSPEYLPFCLAALSRGACGRPRGNRRPDNAKCT